ncbi:hypothetical protein [Clostridium kluyveri]|uniref:Uncharacterized protein n=1 Tax=Clostridium kluyveri (strain ATCC 8527 / DSM 555 / NBRC 12016 / NCIMB 10680 / K1) TaxID=431943 RepID=A5F9J0_CLOK5|nr:hypothetical protein [Clostridium kluyveri]ABQ23672.1 hypothetical protein CKL_4073 [Clostridium kluyveri DSM 555]
MVSSSLEETLNLNKDNEINNTTVGYVSGINEEAKGIYFVGDEGEELILGPEMKARLESFRGHERVISSKEAESMLKQMNIREGDSNGIK